MDKIIERGRLYDYYGGLLTEHQRQIYEAVVYEDMSLGEIAKEHDISRQGVHDLVHRCDRQLAKYEDRLKLIERDEQIYKTLDEITALTEDPKVLELTDSIRSVL